MGVVKKVEKEWKNIIFNLLFIFVCLVLVVALYSKIIILTTFLLFVSIIGLVRWKSSVTLAIFIFGALFGAFAEVIAIQFGAWSYTYTSLLDIPLWLFVLWGNTSCFLYQTGVEFHKLGLHR